MATDRLNLYSDALLLLGERSLASLTEEREARRLLDRVFNGNGIRHCLEAAQWYFAMRTVRIDYDTEIKPDFGHKRAFQKPDDWVLTSAFCADEFFKSPVINYVDEAGYWYASLDTVYVRYVSDDAAYGADYALWPESFNEFVAAHFASKIAWKLTNDQEKVKTILALRQKLLSEAMSRSAMASPTKFPAQGAWVSARRGYGRGYSDRGNNGTLIG